MVFCRVTCVVVVDVDDELLSVVDILASDASASGKLGGVTGVLDGVRIVYEGQLVTPFEQHDGAGDS